MLQYINRIQIFLLKKLQLRPHLLLQRGLQIQKAHEKKIVLVGGGNILMAVMPQIHGYKSIITGTISTMMVICLLDSDISIMNGTI